MNAYINRIAAYLPNEPIANEQMEQLLGTVNSKPSRSKRIVLRNNGIQKRHYVLCPNTGQPRYNNASLTAQAVRRLCGEQFALEQLDCLSVGTSMPDQLMPNHGVMVHGELGNPACEVVTTAGICLAGTTALKYAWMSVLTGQAERAVATGSEVASLVMRSQQFEAETAARIQALEENPELAFEKDFLRWMLSDAAGAVLIQSRPNAEDISLRIDWIDVFSYAHELPACMYAGAVKDEAGKLRGWSQFSHAELGAQSVMAVKQDVKLLNSNVVNYCLVKPLQSLRKKRGLSAEQIDWFLPHMSSYFFEKPIAEGLAEIGMAIPAERWFTNLKERGNTGSASIYLMLEEIFNQRVCQKGQRLLCFVPESGRFSSAFIHLTVV
ncbi:beta-ketoacyl-ACP synthase III [Permianibacter aggregans]|uniref:3-oxoacyl-[acyl-carrier-protein] synthase-3 n=1 Tax=Permianibacter aggregans TaxID=1510150 RepID=A0A4R6UVJ8_9GAMM|nr:beta-ketoacyl-ACP synthase III [Permianibacter aggregans]QGX39402.1 StlD/DarB family beta-ketosynthase [Permianibacter aggregans]TDQ49863.1 3-oxoacyl-[acyl-carrier-protein] synthase-3 [Permianibacter aggregans]